MAKKVASRKQAEKALEKLDNAIATEESKLKDDGLVEITNQFGNKFNVTQERKEMMRANGQLLEIKDERKK